MTWEKILRLAADYLPQWKIPQEPPDMGEVVAGLFTEMMESCEKKFEKLPQRARQELLSLSGIRPLPAKPAHTILVAETENSLSESVRIPKGSPFLYDRNDRENSVVFTSEQEILAVSSKLTDILSVSEKARHISERKLPGMDAPLRLFSAEGENLYREELVLKHSRLMPSVLRIPTAFLRKAGLQCTGARLRAGGAGIQPELLYDGERELNVEKAVVFGEEILEYKECWIGHENVFSKAGAEITLSFELEMKMFQKGAYPEEKKEWKLIQKKPMEDKRQPPDVWPEEIAFSYYSGLGWKKLDLKKDETKIFAQDKRSRRCELRFQCPDDWEQVIAGGNEIKCLRIQVVKAPCCYETIGLHHYPVLSRIQLAYSYGEKGVLPEQVILPREFPYRGENVLLGFDRIFPAGRVSLLFLLAESVRAERKKIVFECSTKDGFCPVAVEDKTDGLIRSGLIYMEIPKKAAKLTVEGRERFFIRLRKSDITDRMQFEPEITGILLNGVEACNFVWTKEREYYLEEAVPYPEFPVEGEYLLEAEVKVREGEQYVLWEEVEDFEKGGYKQRGYVLDRQEKVVRFGDGKRFRVPECTETAAVVIRVCTCEGEFANLPGGTEFIPGYSARLLGRVYQPLLSYGGRNPEIEEQMWKRRAFFMNSKRRLVSKVDFQSQICEYADEAVRTAFVTEEDGTDTLVVLMKDFGKGSLSFEQMKTRLEHMWRDRWGAAFQNMRIKIIEPLVIRVAVEVWLTGQCEDRFLYEEEILNQLEAFFSPECGWEIGRLVSRQDLERMLYQAETTVSLKYLNAVFSYHDLSGTYTWNLDEERKIPTAVCISGEHKVHWIET